MAREPQLPLSAVVLAGGAATRMGGIDKPLLEVDGVPLIRRVLDVIAPLFDDVLLAVGWDGHLRDVPGVRTVPDAVHGIGPISGLRAGLAASVHDWAFVVAVDLPYLDAGLVRRVASLVDDRASAVVPRHRGRREPLHAAYSKRILPATDALIAAGDSKILNLLDRVPVRYLELAEAETRHLLNVNRPTDLPPRNIR